MPPYRAVRAGSKASRAGRVLFDEIDVIDDRGVQRKDSLDADAETGLAYGDRLACAAVLTRNHDTFKTCNLSLVSDSLIRT